MTELDRALSSTLAVLQKVQPGDLDAPTPSASWDVRVLINHFTGTARWWAGVVSGTSEPTDADYAAGDVVAAYQDSARVVAAAFEADGVLGRMVRLPFGEFPGAAARSMPAPGSVRPRLGPGPRYRLPGRPGPRSAGRTARLGPAGDHRRFPRAGRQAPFGPVAPAPAGAGPADHLAAYLGRPV